MTSLLSSWCRQRVAQRKRFEVASRIVPAPCWSRQDFCSTARIYRPGKDRGKPPDDHSSRLSSHLRQIRLPDTWRGRRELEQAKILWDRTFHVGVGINRVGKGHKPREPFLLIIDDRPTARATTARPNAVVFSRNDLFGRKLWEMVNPMPWSEALRLIALAACRSCLKLWKKANRVPFKERSRRVKWFVYYFGGLYSLVLFMWLMEQERVPIIGRWQCQMFPQTSPPPKGTPVSIYCSDVERARLYLHPNDPRAKRLRSILDRILVACGQDHLKWTLLVQDDPDNCNASVTPDGLVEWYSGMFAAAETDDEVASVLSHEIAHVLAHHGLASLSETLLGVLVITPILPFLLPLVLGGVFIDTLQKIAAQPAVIGVLVLLALDRAREMEADKTGMLLMTEAGFDPVATVTYWEKMDRIQQNQQREKRQKQAAEYLSTHPHSASRRSQAALDVPNVLYMVDKGPLRPGMGRKQLRQLEKSKHRWKTFLKKRPTSDKGTQAAQKVPHVYRV
ncbi:MAG: hypothetical protein Q9169_004395 [Polycauliona sp. 2 TL-2023]